MERTARSRSFQNLRCGPPPLTFSLKRERGPMKSTHFLLLSMLLVGCAHHEPTGSFGFSLTSSRDGWRSNRCDFIQTAKDYARSKHLDFNFEDSTPLLEIVCEQGQTTARVWFTYGPGNVFLFVDIDPSGKVVRHHMDYDRG